MAPDPAMRSSDDRALPRGWCAAALCALLAGATGPAAAQGVPGAPPGTPPPGARAGGAAPRSAAPGAPAGERRPAAARPAGAPARLGGAAASRTLRVIGDGRAYAAPDVALATVGVVAIDASLAVAARSANERARRVQEVVAKSGVAPADVQTSRYDVEIERRAEKPEEAPRVVGYRVVNEVRVKVRDLAALGALLDRVVAAGANEVQGVAFAKDDPTPEQGRALAAAVHAARAKAQEMARAAGVQLGDLVELTEGVRTSPGPIVPMVRATAAQGGAAVQSGQLEIDAQVEAVFAIF
jgi:uncharacterized protein YggE